MLKHRYDEIAPQITPEEERCPNPTASAMLYGVLTNWKQRYLLPRLEEASYEDYQRYAEAARDCGAKPKQRPLLEGETIYRALWDIHLAPPLVAGEAISMLVPPNVTVSGNAGDCRIYSWGALAIGNTLKLY